MHAPFLIILVGSVILSWRRRRRLACCTWRFMWRVWCVVCGVWCVVCGVWCATKTTQAHTLSTQKSTPRYRIMMSVSPHVLAYHSGSPRLKQRAASIDSLQSFTTHSSPLTLYNKTKKTLRLSSECRPVFLLWTHILVPKNWKTVFNVLSGLSV